MDGTAYWVQFGTTIYRYDDCRNAWECSACETFWRDLEGGPKGNKMRYCPVCGRYIAVFKGSDE